MDRSKKTSQEAKIARTTVLVDRDRYQRFRIYALEHGTTVTALFDGAMKTILGE